MSLIIDSHAHVVIPPESYKYMAELVSSRANPARGKASRGSVGRHATTTFITIESVAIGFALL